MVKASLHIQGLGSSEVMASDCEPEGILSRFEKKMLLHSCGCSLPVVGHESGCLGVGGVRHVF